MKNIDLSAAKAAQDIVEETRQQKPTDVENLATKALGILQENGVYAALLYLYSQKDSIAKKIRERLLLLISELELAKMEYTSASTALKSLSNNICHDLDKLLLVKQLWEQTLIYTRYGAKARSAEED